MSLSPAEILALTPAEMQMILDQPTMAPPNGGEPNFIDPANWNTVLTITIALGTTFSTLAVAIRYYTKRFIIRKVNIEDYVLVLAWVFAIANTVIALIAHSYGNGVHQWDLPLRVFEGQLKWVNISVIVYDPCIFTIKLSILLLYLRIFVPERRGNMTIFIGIHIFIWANFLCYFIDFFFVLFICTPREKIWNQFYVGGHCFNQNASIEALGIFNAISDFAMLMLPAASIWRLQMQTKRKMGILAIFATGLLGCLTSVARTIYSFKMVGSSDVSWNVTAMGAWSQAEVAIGLIVTSLPCFPMFFKTVKDQWTSLRSTGTSATAATSNSSKIINSIAHRKGSSKPKNPWYDDSALRTYTTLDDGEVVYLVDGSPESVDIQMTTKKATSSVV